MTVYLSVGTNLGDRVQNLVRARRLIAESAGKITAISSEYETEPWGFRSSNRFLNQALAIETDLLPEEILDITKNIEKSLGRTEKTKTAYTDRIIDIDILLADDIVMLTDTLAIPHPAMHRRLFVLKPLCEIAPSKLHPVLNLTVRELLDRCIEHHAPSRYFPSVQSSIIPR